MGTQGFYIYRPLFRARGGEEYNKFDLGLKAADDELFTLSLQQAYPGGVDVRRFMDGQSGRPTYDTWYANQATTDVTVSWAEMIASYSSGTTFILPVGTFLVSTVTTTGEMRFVGQGIQNSIIKQKVGTNGNLFTTTGNFSLLHLQDLTLDGNRANQTSGTVLNLDRIAFASLEMVEIRGGYDYGIYADRCNVLNITDSNIQENGIGFYFKDTGGSGSFRVQGTALQMGDTCQAKIELSGAGSNGVFLGNWFESSGVETPTDQIILNGANHVNVIGNIFNGYGSTNSIINLKTGSYYNTITGNLFENPPSNVGILIDSGAKHNISIGNHGGEPITTDNDGENYIMEVSNTPAEFSMLKRGRIVNKWVALEDSATPSVKKGNYFVTNGTTTPVTDYLDGQDGQEITICFRNDITVTHNASKIILNASADQAFANGDTLSLIKDGSIWKERGRCVQ